MQKEPRDLAGGVLILEEAGTCCPALDRGRRSFDDAVTRALESGPLLQLPSRDQVLFEGELPDMTDPG